MESQIISILIVGANGQLGRNLTLEALSKGRFKVSILLRDRSKAKDLADQVEKAGGNVFIGDIVKPETIKGVTKGIHTVITSLAGLDAYYDGQINLLKDSAENGVKRFVPSEFSFPYESVLPGDHPFLDVKLKFRKELEASQVKGVHVVNGFIMETWIEYNTQFSYWGDVNLKQDLTCYNDIAKYTVAFLADPEKYGTLQIRGEELTVPEMAKIYSQVKGTKVEAKSNGTVDDLKGLITQVQNSGEIGQAIGLGFFFLAFNGRLKLKTIDNEKFSEIKPLSWESFLKSTQN